MTIMTTMTVLSSETINSLKDSLREKREVLMKDKKRATAYIRSLTQSSQKPASRKRKVSKK